MSIEEKLDALKESIDTLNSTLREGMAQAAAARGEAQPGKDTPTAAEASDKPAKPSRARPAAEKNSDAKPAAEKPVAACTYEELRSKLIVFGKEKGDPALISLLAEFGAKNGRELKEADYGRVLDRVEALSNEDNDGLL